jgi:sugar/nucleoside kinase (ribokinase family)
MGDVVLWFRSGKRVLTIGSVHLDTIALSSSPTTHDDVTHVGSITHSVGGSAYNIAANLASHHAKAVREVAIYSILPRHSVLTEIIKY